MGNGRLEAQIYQAANATLSVNDGGGADTATITASSTRYPTDLAAALETALEAATGSGWTVTISDGETGTGLMTIGINAGAASITWVSTWLRDFCGFTGNSASAASHTGTLGVQGMFLPAVPVQGDDFSPNVTGNYIDDSSYQRGPTGSIALWVGNSYRCFRNVRWSHVGIDRALDGYSASLVSWQEWVIQCQRGGNANGIFPVSSAGVPPKVKAYFNADTDTVFGATAGGDGVYYLIIPNDLALARPVDGWDGLHTCVITEMVKV